MIIKKNEKTKMKFFAYRDWYILHFILTIIIGIISIINLVFVWFFYNNYLENFKHQDDIIFNQHGEIESLKDRVKQLENR